MEDDCLYCKCRACSFCTAQIATPVVKAEAVAVVDTTVVSSGGGGGSGGLKSDVETLRKELDLDSSLALPAAVRKACELLCVPHEGPLLATVKKLKEEGLTSLRARVKRLQKELELPERPTLPQMIGLASTQLGVQQPGALPLCKQLDHLFQVVGIKE